jgi:hypothetical protein
MRHFNGLMPNFDIGFCGFYRISKRVENLSNHPFIMRSITSSPYEIGVLAVIHGRKNTGVCPAVCSCSPPQCTKPQAILLSGSRPLTATCPKFPTSRRYVPTTAESFNQSPEKLTRPRIFSSTTTSQCCPRRNFASTHLYTNFESPVPSKDRNSG